MLRYIEGDGPTGWPDPMPPYVWNESSLVGAAKLLRRYHDALNGFVPPSTAQWRIDSAEIDVISHNDVAPFNTVFRNGRPIAMVDFDLAGPGRRIWDVAVGVWRWVPLSTGPSRYPRNVAERVRLFCDSYGLGPERVEVIDVLIARMGDLRMFARREAARGDPGFVKIVGWFPDDSFLLDNIAYVKAHRDEMAAAL
jgi:Ser/Thr protein kinase RdoA (MazF antagonist)